MFRPCVDLHEGRVKQIVGGSLRDGEAPPTNFETGLSPGEFVRLYRRDGLKGGHVIKLGPGNDNVALEVLRAWPGGMQLGGGVTADNASSWLDAGASHVIVTSYVFRDGLIDYGRLGKLVQAVGADHIVLDLSCRVLNGRYVVVTDRWQKFTEVVVNAVSLANLANSCAEFLVHAADVEGKRAGIDERLVSLLAEDSPLPVTYAGGAKELADLSRVYVIGHGRVSLTIGSGLDIFGGSIAYKDVVALHHKLTAE